MTDQRKIIATLKTARELISDRERWTCRSHARDKHGDPRRVTDPDACQFCGMGALYRVADGHLDAREQHNATMHLFCGIRALAKSGQLPSYCQSLTFVNDDLGHWAIMEVYDRAIEIAEREVR